MRFIDNNKVEFILKENTLPLRIGLKRSENDIGLVDVKILV